MITEESRELTSAMIAEEHLEFITDQFLVSGKVAATVLDGIRAMIGCADDETRDGLRDTPRRVFKAFMEMTAGYQLNPKEILATVFEGKSDEMILLRNIEFTSICEHHLLPFVGTATIGYLPGLVVGISKLARLVDCFARRLQIQERMTTQIAESIAEHLRAEGVGVIIKARHECMGCRGVKQPTAEMITSAMLGRLRKNSPSRLEFLLLNQ